LTSHWCAPQRTAWQKIFGGEVKRPMLESAIILSRAAIYLTCVFLVLTPAQAVCFVLVQQTVQGVYFGLLFAPNHKGMPVRRDGEERDVHDRQVEVDHDDAGAQEGQVQTAVAGGGGSGRSHCRDASRGSEEYRRRRRRTGGTRTPPCAGSWPKSPRTRPKRLTRWGSSTSRWTEKCCEARGATATRPSR
jgi:hypothetical protein